MSFSDSPGNLAGTQATGAGVDIFRGAIYNRLYSLHVRLPGTVGTPMGMGNLDAEGHPFSAAITLCHLLHLLFSSRYNIIANRSVKCKGFAQKTQKRSTERKKTAAKRVRRLFDLPPHRRKAAPCSAAPDGDRKASARFCFFRFCAFSGNDRYRPALLLVKPKQNRYNIKVL